MDTFYRTVTSIHWKVLETIVLQTIDYRRRLPVKSVVVNLQINKHYKIESQFLHNLHIYQILTHLIDYENFMLNTLIV